MCAVYSYCRFRSMYIVLLLSTQNCTPQTIWVQTVYSQFTSFDQFQIHSNFVHIPYFNKHTQIYILKFWESLIWILEHGILYWWTDYKKLTSIWRPKKPNTHARNLNFAGGMLYLLYSLYYMMHDVSICWLMWSLICYKHCSEWLWKRHCLANIQK